MRKFKILALLLVVMTLCGCRTRVVTQVLDAPPAEMEGGASTQRAAALVRPDSAAEPDPEELNMETTEPDTPAEPDETSARREFSGSASGELVSGAETPLYAAAEEPAAAAAVGDGANEAVNVEADSAGLSATETVREDESSQLGVDEGGMAAESVQAYYLALLADRVGPLFECKRLYVYWETEDDHTTIHKSAAEHRLIMDAGAYDVSAKLLEENLIVDDGWVSRKNPDAVVKVAGGGALDLGGARTLCNELAARPGWEGIAAVRNRQVIVLSETLLGSQAGRTAAAVYLAKMLYPSQMEDVDPDEALRALTQEATGSAYSGAYAYTM